MKVYITMGTSTYLSKVKEKSNEANLYLLNSPDSSLLFHETDGPSVFKEGKEYEVVDAVGEIEQAGFAILNNIPVTDEGRPIFEYRFENRARLIENEPGFKAIRVLRPLSNDIYIIFTLWEDHHSFKNWQESKSYEKAHAKRGTGEAVSAKKDIFSRPSYVTQYSLNEEEGE